MGCIFKKIFERDIDLLIIEEMLVNNNFLSLFLHKLSMKDGFSVCDAYHSLSDSDGESDITIILENNGEKHALLIEDKIDAPTMPEQSQRYHIRGEKLKREKKITDYTVLIAAPQAYLDEHQSDKNAEYKNRISYEEMIDFFRKAGDARSLHKADILAFAVKEKKTGYIVSPDQQVSEFWQNLHTYQKTHFPRLFMPGADAVKGASALWPEFRTPLKNVALIYKADKGYVDLQFSGYGDRINILNQRLKPFLAQDMEICSAGKSASIRLKSDNWKISFKENFYQHENAIHSVLEAVDRLYEFCLSLDYKELY